MWDSVNRLAYEQKILIISCIVIVIVSPTIIHNMLTQIDTNLIWHLMTVDVDHVHEGKHEHIVFSSKYTRSAKKFVRSIEITVVLLDEFCI